MLPRDRHQLDFGRSGPGGLVHRAIHNVTDTAQPPASGKNAPPRDTRRVVHPALEPRIIRKQDKLGIDWIVFGITAVLSLAFVLWGVISTSSLSDASASGLDWVVTNTGWLFALASTGFVFFVIWLAASKYGNIPLGADGE